MLGGKGRDIRPKMMHFGRPSIKHNTTAVDLQAHACRWPWCQEPSPSPRQRVQGSRDISPMSRARRLQHMRRVRPASVVHRRMRLHDWICATLAKIASCGEIGARVTRYGLDPVHAMCAHPRSEALFRSTQRVPNFAGRCAELHDTACLTIRLGALAGAQSAQRATKARESSD